MNPSCSYFVEMFFVFWFVRKRVSYKVVAFRIILFSEWFEKSETTHSPYKWMLNQPEVFWIFVTKCLEKCFFGVESNFRVSNLGEVEKKSKNCRKLPKIQNLKLKMSKGKELAWNGWLIEWEIISSRLLEKKIEKKSNFLLSDENDRKYFSSRDSWKI